jgi:hypothetical protein
MSFGRGHCMCVSQVHFAGVEREHTSVLDSDE